MSVNVIGKWEFFKFLNTEIKCNVLRPMKNQFAHFFKFHFFNLFI